jgi:EAL domain-containing protein (putative c-di-GMP-specific phosphodiesterase class I)
LSAPIDVQGNTLYATASIGIVTDKQLDLAKGTEGALADADLAMYTAKSNGKNRVALFDESLRTQVQHRLELEQDLRRALYFGEFSMKYQPIMSLSEGTIASFEALIRWNSPTRGFVSPADFIPVAEESGLIIGLGDWVMEEVCRQILEWQAVHPEKKISVSINVSRKQLMLPLFAERVEHLVRGMGIEPSYIHLEVTESALMANTEIATQTLKQLRDAGFHIDLDDFGTGYTSLADLDNFPLDIIKIDKSFVDDITSGGRRMEVIRAVRTLGNAIGAKIIAEGVENEDQLRMVYYMGIDMAQGYLISRPLDPDDAILFEYDLGAKLRAAA